MDTTMDPIFPISALQKRQGEVKRAAQSHIVRITENGVGAYVFCTEEAFQRKLAEAAEQAAYEERLANAIQRGREDISAGRSVVGLQAARAAVESLAADE